MNCGSQQRPLTCHCLLKHFLSVLFLCPIPINANSLGYSMDFKENLHSKPQETMVIPCFFSHEIPEITCHKTPRSVATRKSRPPMELPWPVKAPLTWSSWRSRRSSESSVEPVGPLLDLSQVTRGPLEVFKYLVI